MKITVTQNDINSGYRYSCNQCPVALAIKRAMGRTPIVGCFRVTFEDEAGRVPYEPAYELPFDVREAIQHFDNGAQIDPFEFELRPI